MAGDLTFKSLNIEFGADDSGFNKSLTKINGELRAISALGRQMDKDLKFDNAEDGVKKLNQILDVQQDELKGVQSKLKALTSEYERLSELDINTLVDKQKELKQEVADSEARTKELTTQLKEMEKAGKIDTTEFKQLKEELEDSKTATKDFRAELKQTNDDIGRIEPQKMAKLGTEILKTTNYEEGLNNKIQQTGKDIKNLDSGEFDQLSTKVKMAGSEMKDLSKYAGKSFKEIEEGAKDASKGISKIDEESSTLSDTLGSLQEGGAGDVIAGLGADAAGASPELETLAGAIGSGALALGPLAAGAVAAGAALKILYDRANENREIQGQLESTIGTSNVSIKDQTKAVRDLSRATGLDLAEATDIAREANQDYGDALQSSSDITEAGLGIVAMQKYGNLEAADAYRALSSNAANFDDTMVQHNETIGKTIFMMQNYGDRADDIIDTQHEWGDTFAATGQSSEQMFNILNAGMAAGARNTDEVANAWNEFQLRLGDGSAEEAINSIGLSYEDITKKFNAGGVEAQLAFTQVIGGLLGIEDQTQRTAVGFSIFGTQGEEFISTLNASKTEIDAVSESLKGQQLIQEGVNNTLEKNSAFWDVYAEKNNLTSIQVENLKNKIKEQGLASVDTELQNAIMGEGLTFLAEKYKLTDKETKNLTETYKILRGEQDLTKISQKGFADGLETMYNAGLLTKDAMNTLTDASKRYREEGLSLTNKEVEALNYNFAEMTKQGQINAGEQYNLAKAVNTLGKESITSEKGLGALKDMTNILGESGKLSADGVKTMNSAIKTLGDENATTEEKLKATKKVVDGLEESTAISGTTADNYRKKLDDLSEAADNGSTSQDGLKNKIDDSKKAMDENNTSMEELTKIYVSSLSTAQKISVEQALGSKRFNELTQATNDNKKATDDNTKSKDNNSTSAKGVAKSAAEEERSQMQAARAHGEASTKARDNAQAKGETAKASENEKKKVDEATGSEKEYNALDIVKKTFETNAEETQKKIDDAVEAGKDWNLFTPVQKVFTTVWENITKGKAGGSGGSSGSSGGSQEKSTQRTSQNARNNTFSPTIQVTLNGSGNSQADGLAVGKAAAREMYKMGVVTK